MSSGRLACAVRAGDTVYMYMSAPVPAVRVVVACSRRCNLFKA